MKSVVRFALALLLAAFAGAARAEVPLEPAAFTAYMQQKVQLYSPSPISIAGPLRLGASAGTADLTALHDQCVQAPAKCDGLVHDFVQNFARNTQPRAATAAPPSTLPEDQDAFMSLVAAELQRRLPSAQIGTSGTRLVVTRAAGKPIPLDLLYYYRSCAHLNFACRAQMDELLDELGNWLEPLRPDTLRASLHIMDSCTTIISVGSSGSCRIVPSHEPMAVFFRRAFANLEVVCFKSVADGSLRPAINADRNDLGLDIDGALDRCTKQTRETLPALALDAGGGVIDAPYAATLAMFPDEWSRALGSRSVLIAVPSRDRLLYSAGTSDAEVAAFTAKTLQAFQSAGGFAVSADVYRWTGNTFVLVGRSVMMNGGPITSIDLIPREGGRGL